MGEPEGSTVWTGSAFNCTSREISLFHSQYESTEGVYGECEEIIGRSLKKSIATINRADEFNSTSPKYFSFYTSQLSVPISSDKAEKTIECLYDDKAAFTTVGQATIKFNTTIGIENWCMVIPFHSLVFIDPSNHSIGCT